MPGGVTDAERTVMAHAIELASAPDLRPHPNPRVGAVVLAPDGRLLAEGVHRGAGTPHAEIHALAEAGAAARGATMVVSLEPCQHHGRTGPCTEALATAGIARVIFAQSDPNPVAGGGAEWLSRAGIEVVGGVLAEQSRDVNLMWTLAMERQRPWVTWKVAHTLDGRVAAADGTSRWITGADARADVHELRALVDAIVVGTGTVLADDPALTVRVGGAPEVTRDRQPLRVVVGRRPVPVGARVLDAEASTLILPTHDVADVLSALFAADVHHALLEGGPTLAAAFVRAGAVDDVVGYIAPTLLGSGSSMVGDLGVTTIDDRRDLDVYDVAMVGRDLRWRARLSTARTQEASRAASQASTEGTL